MRSVLALWMILYSQDAQPAFEAATVKINKDGPQAGNGFVPSPGRLRVINTTLPQLIQAAFHVKTGALSGMTAWMESDRFDIDAKAPGRSTFDEDMPMLQSLLTDRFQLRFHRETRQLRTQFLVLAKGGPKFQRSKNQDEKEQITIRPTEISGTGIPFGHFVTILEAQLKYPITNETGISGQFDLSLKYVRDDAPGGAEGPSVFAALEDQLGLKLEARRGPVEVFVIDSAQRPAEN
jgi:uncharacterized protein (TIGR03435 family)